MCRISEEQSESDGTWATPHCGCGHPLTRNKNYNWNKIVKDTIDNGETEFYNNERYIKTTKYADCTYYVDSSQILSRMSEKILQQSRQ